MRTMSPRSKRSAVLRVGLLSTATLVLAACSSDASRISLFGVDSEPPAQAYPVQPVAQAPIAQPPFAAPPPAQGPAPYTAPVYTAPNYSAPGYPQSTASVGVSPVQVGQPQPLPAAPAQTFGAPVAQRGVATAPVPSRNVGAPLAQPNRLNQGFTQARSQQVPAQLPATYTAPQPITTAALPAQQASLPAPAALPQVTGTSSVSRSSGGWSTIGGTRVNVQPGDTLFSMSRRYGVPAQVLQDVNGLSSPDGLRAGQQLVIPVFSTAAAAPTRSDTTITGTNTVSNRAAPAPTPRPRAASVRQQPQTVAQPSNAVSGTHTVTSGDTAFNISRRYGMTVEELARLNGLSNPGAIRIGQRLRVSGTAPVQNQQVAATSATPTPATSSVTRPAPVRTPSQEVAARSYTPPQRPAEQPQVVGRAAPQPAAVAAADDANATPLQFRWPIRGRVVSNFGTQSNGVSNDGINIAVPEGASIRAAEDGEVVYAGNELRGFGNLVLIQHRSGYVTAYAHNSRINVQRGDRVSRGEIVARAGSTGDVDTPQLHFEIRRGTTPVDPRPYLPQG
ncbi:MAG: LysM peptidoglycan-binding domain-containing protein [Pseudomonadota bacterium]